MGLVRRLLEMRFNQPGGAATSPLTADCMATLRINSGVPGRNGCDVPDTGGVQGLCAALAGQRRTRCAGVSLCAILRQEPRQLTSTTARRKFCVVVLE